MELLGSSRAEPRRRHGLQTCVKLPRRPCAHRLLPRATPYMPWPCKRGMARLPHPLPPFWLSSTRLRSSLPACFSTVDRREPVRWFVGTDSSSVTSKSPCVPRTNLPQAVLLALPAYHRHRWICNASRVLDSFLPRRVRTHPGKG